MANTTIQPAPILDALSKPRLDIRATSDGHVDLKHLESTADVATVMQWIRYRLMGRDPFWPINLHDMEPPHDLFVTLALRSGPKGLTSALIEESVFELLVEARRTNPSWRGELLQLVRVLRPKRCFSYLESIVRQRHSFSNDQIQEGVDTDWLLTAAAYPPDSLFGEWLEILKKPDPRHSATAYRALAQDWFLALRFLPDFALSLRSEDRPMLVRSAVRLSFERCRSTDLFLDKLKQNWIAFGRVTGLRDYVQEALRSLKIPIPQFLSMELAVPADRPKPKTTVSYAGAAMRPALAF